MNRKCSSNLPYCARLVLLLGCLLGLLGAGSSGTFAAGVAAVAPKGTGYTLGGEWESYNKTLDGQRYSPLDQINTENAASLTEVCRVPIVKLGSFQAGLVVIGNTMFATTATDTIAIDPVTCAIKWRHTYRRNAPPVLQVNRGVAYLNGRLFRGTDDGYLIALDAKTGTEVWTSIVGDSRSGETVTATPVAWNGLVIVGTAVSEAGIRGRVAAYDAETGREVWRFHTIPTGKETGADSWPDNFWDGHRGGGTWSTFSIDSVTAEVFIPVGNPIPDFAPSDRPGANLFTNSVVVLDARTGQLKWWYQLNANDPWDHDLAAAPILYYNSKKQEMLAAAGKDGYLHIVDRTTHNLVVKTPVTTVTANPPLPSPDGVNVCPGIIGGTLWNGPAYDPVRNTLFVGAVDWCSNYKSKPGTKLNIGGSYGWHFGGSWTNAQPDPMTGWITALDGDTGKVRWKFHAESAVVSGITPTAGGIVMGGDNIGNFLVFNSATGEVLKKVATGGSLHGGVITYEQNGKQYVAFNSGNTSPTLLGTYGRPTVIVMALPKSADAKSTPSVKQKNARGERMWFSRCYPCHMPDGVPLSDQAKKMKRDLMISLIKNPPPAMPKTFPVPPDREDEADLQALADYLQQ